MAPSAPNDALLLCEFSVQNFRSFRDRQVISFQPDVTVFHGDTGSGKSTALVALDVFFRALAVAQNAQPQGLVFPWSERFDPFAQGKPTVLLSERDRPHATEPTVLAATFRHMPSAWVEIRFEPAGAGVKLTWNRAVDPGFPAALLQRQLFPFGSRSHPLGILDARRRPQWSREPAGSSLLAPSLANRLYELRTSRVAADRERWRSFASALSEFPTLKGATVEIEAGRGERPPELVIEHPGRAVLGLDELSSGEQELAALTAGLLLARAAIVAIEEPEMGLDSATQELWKQVCERQRTAGLMHQVIYESHAVTFDGAGVVRFRRGGDGATIVENHATAKNALAVEAEKSGAREVFVTREGFTKLPTPMLDEIRPGENGAHVWFLRGKNTWEAWPEEKLEGLLAENEK